MVALGSICCVDGSCVLPNPFTLPDGEPCVQLEWQYAIGVPCNTYITLVDGRYGRIDGMVPYKKNRYFQSVWLTQQRKLCTNLSVTWTVDGKGHAAWSP